MLLEAGVFGMTVPSGITCQFEQCTARKLATPIATSREVPRDDKGCESKVPVRAEPGAVSRRMVSALGGSNRLGRDFQRGAGPDSARGAEGLECEEGDLNPHGCYPTSPSN